EGSEKGEERPKRQGKSPPEDGACREDRQSENGAGFGTNPDQQTCHSLKHAYE
ncbi:MAG: hypothetical protein H6Q04_2892, partial [Acidobacteria bacterium]|nr:hypothetical protein [Acidobacteriota bacterium]